MMWLELFNFLHFVGLAFGLGGATIATIISLKANKDKEIVNVLGKILPSIVNLIWLGLIFLVVSGIALPFFIKWPLNKEMLFIKHILVIFIVIFGIAIGIFSRKKAMKEVKIFSIINLILWYFVTFLSAFV